MTTMVSLIGSVCLISVLAAAPGVLAQAPAITPARVKARKELGQLGVEYSKHSFVKQASEGDTIAVQLFLAAGMDPNGFDSAITDNALMAAVRAGHLETVSALLAGGADPRIGITLILATRLDVLRLLLDHGADAKGEYGYAALVSVVWQGRVDMVNLLLERGADVNPKGSGDGSALMTAVEVAASIRTNNGRPADEDAKRQRIDIVKVLVERKANLNSKDYQGKTALHIAAQKGAVDLVRFLLDRGADVNAGDKQGKTALINAIEGGSADLVKIFLEKGADVNIRVGARTPLSLAAELHKPEIVQLLINAGAKQ